MATGGDERRMVFDIRGRRRYAIKVIYAILAILMGASLFLVVGPLNIGEIFNSSGGSGGEAAKTFEEQAERIERRLKKQPGDPDLLASLTRAHVTAANTLTEVEASGQRVVTPEALQQLQEASQAWSEYLKATKEPAAGVGQLVAPAMFQLAEVSTGGEIEPNLEAAAQAQEIVAEQRPNLNTLSTLAIYRLFTFDYKQAEAAAKRAKTYARTKFERENVDNQLKETRKRAESFQQQLQAYEKALAKASKTGGGAGAEALKNPFGGLGGSSGLGE
jgi:hypothetical protein